MASGDIALVVPIRNGERRVGPLLDAVLTSGRRRSDRFTIILVDDASDDQTWTAISDAAAEHSRVLGVRLSEHVGQTGALCAGFAASTSNVVVTIDDDIDVEPADLWELVDAIDRGADFAGGIRTGSRQPLRSVASALYNTRLRSLGFPFHDAGCGAMALRRPLADRVAASGWEVRQHRFKPRITLWTDKVVEVPVRSRPTTGSHFNLTYLAMSWLDVELEFGRLTRGRAVALIGGLLVLGTSSMLLPWRRGGVLRSVPGLTALGAALAALRVLLARDQMVAQTLSTAPFTIVETVGSGS